jgi:hypothetical protein
LSDIAAVCALLPHFGRTKCDVPITRKLRSSKKWRADCGARDHLEFARALSAGLVRMNKAAN